MCLCYVCQFNHQQDDIHCWTYASPLQHHKYSNHPSIGLHDYDVIGQPTQHLSVPVCTDRHKYNLSIYLDLVLLSAINQCLPLHTMVINSAVTKYHGHFLPL